MQAVKIKICGVTDERTVEALNLFKPDYAGFVFAPSPRRISFPAAERLRRLLDGAIASVGVFVNPTIGALERAAPILDLIQLHGDEDETFVERARRIRPVIKAVRTKDGRINGSADRADYALIEGYSEAGRGGIGSPADPNALRGYRGAPFFLAGGLTAENVGRALAFCPFGVDVSSGVETAGAKDPAKIEAFIRKVKEYVG